MPFEAALPDLAGNAATGESSVIFDGSGSFGVSAASLLPFGVADVKLEESLVVIAWKWECLRLPMSPEKDHLLRTSRHHEAVPSQQYWLVLWKFPIHWLKNKGCKY